MLNILIVDDSSDKIDNILNVINGYAEISDSAIDVAKTIIEAKAKLRTLQYSLVILDIQMPNREGDDPNPNAGVDLLRELHERSVYKKPHCILGLTEFEDLAQEASPIFAERLWSLHGYSPSSREWEDRIKSKIEYLIEFEREPSNGTQHICDCLILTALNHPEFTPIFQRGKWIENFQTNDPTRYLRCDNLISKTNAIFIAAHAPQMGMPAAAVLATKAICQFRPRIIVMTGISAGVPGKTAIGDLVVADPCWDWGSGKQVRSKENTSFEPDPIQERISPKIKAMLEDARRDSDLFKRLWDGFDGEKPLYPPILHIGPCASGACVVSDESLRDSVILHSRKLIGLDMEAYGLMHAANQAMYPPVLAFSVKTVCDFANAEKIDKYQEYGSYLSFEFMLNVVGKYLL